MAEGEIIRWKRNLLTGGGDEERTNNQKQSQ